MSDPGATRATPFHCPYCGEEELRPENGTDGTDRAAWLCEACRRVFAVRFVGLRIPEVSR
ncbi:Insertion element protein [Saccharomonospora xinjiangensis]|uniref:Insertion element protein n=1 Tax=Saccharomonospora xinjiangensis TaxID=75294 RepID=UPI00350FFCAD